MYSTLRNISHFIFLRLRFGRNYRLYDGHDFPNGSSTKNIGMIGMILFISGFIVLAVGIGVICCIRRRSNALEGDMLYS